MDDRNANAYRKVVRWIWLGAGEFLFPLVPLAILCLALVLCAWGVRSLLVTFGIATTAPKANSAEDAVFLFLLVPLAMIVVPLLLRIARVLERDC